MINSNAFTDMQVIARAMAKELELNTPVNLYQYIIDSYINGQKKQAKAIYKELAPDNFNVNDKSQDFFILYACETLAPELLGLYDTAYLIKTRYPEHVTPDSLLFKLFHCIL